MLLRKGGDTGVILVWWLPVLGDRAVAPLLVLGRPEAGNDDETRNYYLFRGSGSIETNLEG